MGLFMDPRTLFYFFYLCFIFFLSSIYAQFMDRFVSAILLCYTSFKFI